MRGRYGQMITFAIERDEDSKQAGWIAVDIHKHDSIASIANRRGHSEDAKLIQERNRPRGGPRSIYSEFSGRGLKTLMVPRTLRTAFSFSAYAGDKPPTIVAGYAKLSVLDRPERVGLSVFDGYDPSQLKVPIRFESRDGTQVEADIALLEYMAGRGNPPGDLGPGSSVGAPPILHISVTDGDQVVPLIPNNYQRTLQNPSGPLYRIADLQWDDDPGKGVRRNRAGNRTRQLVDVIVQQHVSINLATRSSSASHRARAKSKSKSKSKSKK